MRSQEHVREEYKGITFVICAIFGIVILWVLAGIGMMIFIKTHWIGSFCLFFWVILTIWFWCRIFDIKDRMYRKLFHWKIFWFGHKELEENGFANLPCKRCGTIFKSYEHYGKDGGYCYDSLCEDCAAEVDEK